jgi:hypothetical protein
MTKANETTAGGVTNAYDRIVLRRDAGAAGCWSRFQRAVRTAAATDFDRGAALQRALANRGKMWVVT